MWFLHGPANVSCLTVATLHNGMKEPSQKARRPQAIDAT